MSKKLLVTFLLCSIWLAAGAAVFEVGPGKPCSAIAEVPWETLQAGDVVLIHARTNAYREKMVLCRQGTATAPIVIRGVSGPDGALPILDGENATTRTNLSFWGETRAVIKVGGASKPADTMPKFLVIENLEVRGARPPNSFVSANRSTQAYGNNAASIWIEKGENITIRNCVIHDSGNGLFVSSSDSQVSKNILVERCHLFGNGNAGSAYEHNVYSAALGITFQFNRFGPLRAGCPGNNLKDRSAGLTVRYNWIEGGNRQLDLVDAEDSAVLRNDPAYRSTLVYGNVLLELPADGNKQMVHYGGDSGSAANYRKGTLHFFNNTLVSRRADQTTLFRFSTNDEQADARNNIFFPTNSGSSLALVDSVGTLHLKRNWLKAGWKNSFSTLTGSIVNDGSNLNGTSTPGFQDEPSNDFRLASSSTCVNAGIALNSSVLPAHNLTAQYLRHQSSEARPDDNALDLGAFEATPLELWRTARFGTNASNPAVAWDEADPDADGICNLLEYAFDLDPLASSREGVPEAAVVTSSDGSSFLALRFATRRPSGLSYTVQTSADLLQWEDTCRYTDGTNVLVSAAAIDISETNSTRRLVRLTTPVSSGEMRFLRVNVQKE